MREEFEAFVATLNLQHFSAGELLHRTDGVRNGVANSIPERALWPNVVPTILVLDALRKHLGAGVTITSGYRNPAYNAAVGGGTASQHLDYRALDFRCARGTPDDWANVLRSWRGRPFASPDALAMVAEHASLSTAGLQINRTAQGTAFTFAGGLGVYPNSNFVHIDCRGDNRDWRGS